MIPILRKKWLGLPAWFCAALLIVAAYGLRLRVEGADHDFIFSWDEAFHALVGRNFLAHPLTPILLENYPDWIPADHWLQTGVWLHKPPFSMWMIAFSVALFGEEEFSLRLPSIFADTLLIFILGVYFGRQVRPLVGFGVAMLWALCAAMIALTGGIRATDHPDVWLTFFSMLALLLLAHGWTAPPKRWPFFFAGVCLGGAILTKGLTGILIGIAAGSFGAFALLRLLIDNGWNWRDPRIRTGPRMAGWMALGSAVCLPWLIMVRIRFPEQSAVESRYSWVHIGTAVEGHTGGPLFHFDQLMLDITGWTGIWAGWVGLLLVLFCVQWGFSRKSVLHRLSAMWVLVVFGAFTLAATKMRYYTMPAWPAVFFLAWDAVVSGFDRLFNGPQREFIRLRISLATLLLILWPMHLQASACIARASRLKRALSRTYDYADFRKKMIGVSKDHSPAIVWNVPGLYIQAAYYSHKIALAIRPTRVLVEQARQSGLRNYVMVTRASADWPLFEQELSGADPELQFIEVKPGTEFVSPSS